MTEVTYYKWRRGRPLVKAPLKKETGPRSGVAKPVEAVAKPSVVKLVGLTKTLTSYIKEILAEASILTTRCAKLEADNAKLKKALAAITD